MGFDESLNTRHISKNLNNYEAARTGFFTLIIHGLDNLVKPSFTGDPVDAPDANRIAEVKAQEDLKLNVIKCPIPHFEVGVEKYRRGNDVVNFATTPTWNGGTMTIDDIVGLDTKSTLMAWLYLAYNPHTRKGGRMKDYKKSATLCEYTQDYELIRTWHIDGIFITKLSEDDFDRENDGPRKITADFIFDRATVILPEDEEE